MVPLSLYTEGRFTIHSMRMIFNQNMVRNVKIEDLLKYYGRSYGGAKVSNIDIVMTK